MHKTNLKYYKKLTWGPYVWIKATTLPESKAKVFGLSPLPMQNLCWNLFLNTNLLFMNHVLNFLQHILGQKEY